jgi:hypothetical protein
MLKFRKNKLSNKNLFFLRVIYKMVKTRNQIRTRKQLYRSRVKSSVCRGKSFTTCRLKNGCKRTMAGRRKSYCRKRTNRNA